MLKRILRNQIEMKEDLTELREMVKMRSNTDASEDEDELFPLPVARAEDIDRLDAYCRDSRKIVSV